MAIKLKLTDGATTLHFDATAADVFGGATYAPEPPAVSEIDAPFASTSEAMTIKLEGTAAEIVTAMQSIELLIRQARRRQTDGAGARVYLQYAPYSTATAVQSEVLDGRLIVDRDPTRRQFTRGVVMVALDVTRRAYWEATADVTLGTGGITNNGSANHLIVSGVAGTMPAPAKITLTAGAALDWARFYVSVNAFNDPAGFSSTVGAKTLTWLDDADHGSSVATWTLTAAQLADTKGDWFRALACFGSSPFWAPSDATLQLRLRYSVTDVYAGDEVYTAIGVTRGIYDLGALPLPPGGWGATNLAMTLSLSIRAELAGTSNLGIIQFMPAAPGQFRTWEQIGYTVASGDKIVDDPYAETINLESSTGNRLGLVQGLGDPLLLWPGQSNRVTVLFDESNAATRWSSTRTSTLAVAYRPRYLSV